MVQIECVSLPAYIVAGWERLAIARCGPVGVNAGFCPCSPMFENLTLRADVVVVRGIESKSLTAQQTARSVLSVEDGDMRNDFSIP